MADPEAAAASQLRNIEGKTGKTFAQLCKLIAASKLTKVGEQRAMLMESLGLGYGDANMLALRAKQAALPAAVGADPLDAIYAGPKAPLRDSTSACTPRSASSDRSKSRPRRPTSACAGRSSSPRSDPQRRINSSLDSMRSRFPLHHD